MSRESYFNVAGLVLTLSLAGVFGARSGAGTATPAFRPPVENTTSPASRRLSLGSGLWGLPDARGHIVALRDFHRIVSTSLVVDRLLVELCEPNRIVAFSDSGERQSPWDYRYAGKSRIKGLRDIENLIELRPDLVLTNNFNDPARVTRLREAGIEVFDFGEIHGLATLLPQAETLAELLGKPERGTAWGRGFSRRFQTVAAGLGATPRKRGIYVAAYGTELFGGAPGTGYHDVLVAAGLIDAAEGRFSNWPHYRTEDLIALDSDIIVTKKGMSSLICRGSSLELLRACRTREAVIELPAELIDDPGPMMLDAAEELFSSAYGDARN